MDNDHKISNYDRTYGNYHNSQFIHSRTHTVRHTDFLGQSETFIFDTVRTDDGDIVFMECLSSEGHVRLRIPATVINALTRQRESLAGKVRRVKGRAAMEARMADGFVPTFAAKKETA